MMKVAMRQDDKILWSQIYESTRDGCTFSTTYSYNHLSSNMYTGLYMQSDT